MVLSRIWSAFILIAIVVALGQYLFQPGQQQIFSQMVTGKTGDTTYVQYLDSNKIPLSVRQKFTEGASATRWENHQVAPLENEIGRAHV